MQWDRIVLRFSKQNVIEMAETLNRLSKDKIAIYQLNVNRIFTNYFQSKTQNINAIIAILRRRHSISNLPEHYPSVSPVSYNLVTHNGTTEYISQKLELKGHIIMDSVSHLAKPNEIPTSTLNLPKGICTNPMTPCDSRMKDLSARSGLSKVFVSQLIILFT